MIYAIVAVVGVMVGGTAVWVVQRNRFLSFYDKGKQEGEVDREVLRERLTNTERMLQEANASMEDLTALVKSFRK